MEVTLYARHPFQGGAGDNSWTPLKQEVHRHELTCFFDTLGCLPF